LPVTFSTAAKVRRFFQSHNFSDRFFAVFFVPEYDSDLTYGERAAEGNKLGNMPIKIYEISYQMLRKREEKRIFACFLRHP
jgi:hypothetical protein